MWRKTRGAQGGGGKCARGEPRNPPSAKPEVSPPPSEAYQNGGDDKRPVSQGIRDVGRSVLVAVRHVKATV